MRVLSKQKTKIGTKMKTHTRSLSHAYANPFDIWIYFQYSMMKCIGAIILKFIVSNMNFGELSWAHVRAHSHTHAHILESERWAWAIKYQSGNNTCCLHNMTIQTESQTEPSWTELILWHCSLSTDFHSTFYLARLPTYGRLCVSVRADIFYL